MTAETLGHSPKPVLAIVEDDEILRLVLSRGLKGAFDVRTYGQAEPFLDALAAGEAFDALLFDYRLPGIEGGAVAALLEAKYPALLARSVLMTGRALEELDGSLKVRLGGRILEKPFTIAGVTDAIQRLLPRAP